MKTLPKECAGPVVGRPLNKSNQHRGLRAGPLRRWCSQPAPPRRCAAPPGTPLADWPAYNRTLAGIGTPAWGRSASRMQGQLTLRCAFTLPEVVSFQTGPRWSLAGPCTSRPSRAHTPSMRQPARRSGVDTPKVPGHQAFLVNRGFCLPGWAAVPGDSRCTCDAP